MAILLTLVSVFILVFTDKELSNLITLTVTWIGETTAFSGFYMWKEKNANRSKYA
jgi:hypothetical protein